MTFGVARTLAQRSLRRTALGQQQQTRHMGGGVHYMTVGENHRIAGEVFGTVCWLWIFHRARQDGPVLLGWRHPWEH